MTEIDNLKERGFNLIPLKPRSKEPIGGLNWKQFQKEQYTGSYPPSCNVAVICGSTSGNLYVVDLDDESLYSELPSSMMETYTVKTGKGFHLYFYYTNVPAPNKKLDDKRGRHIDIKSQGGYVLASGSIHPNGDTYKVINDSPIKTLEGRDLKDYLEKMGFNVNTKTIDEIEEGVSEGGRNDSTFKYACSMIRDRGLYGEALNLQMAILNKKHSPPLGQTELDLIISQAIKAEKNSMIRHIRDARSVVEQLSSAPKVITMQEITPSFENKPITFDCMIIAVGERMTYTVEADCSCLICQKVMRVVCDDMHKLPMPFCMKHKRPYDIDESTKVTAYIQQLRIQEFLENARNSSPIQFDAEIVDESVGEAFISDRKTITAKFRSVPKKNSPYNNIVFQITDMTDLEQKEGCLPTAEEIEKWKGINIFNRVTESIAPDIYMNKMIIQSLILWACGGNSLNGKRDLIHMAILGDAQLGKTELLLKMHKLLVGSGYTVGRNVSGAGLTIAMVKMYNGVMIPEAGYFPQHTGHPCIIDEIDKMEKKDHNVCLEVMENQTTTNNKAGSHGGMTLPTVCQLLVAGNPKNGKFNPKYPSVMDNFDMEMPFVSRFDLLWMLTDENSPETDVKIIQHIRSYEKRKDRYMKMDELQRYFEYIKTIDAVISDKFLDKIDILHRKMRLLNVESGVPIGIRQYHGLYRLVTACAKAHLRNEVTDEDFEIVENIIIESYSSMKMDLETGVVSDKMITKKNTFDTQILEVWKNCMDDELEGTVDKSEFITALNIKRGKLDGGRIADRLLDGVGFIYDNDLERWKKI